MKRICTFLTALLLAPLAAVEAADFHVAPEGQDTNPGTAAAPFATLARARDAVRGKIKDGLTKEIVVAIRSGTYPMTETLTFGPEDSGTEKLSIAYRKVKCGEEMGGGGAPRESRNGGIVARKRR